MTDLRIHFDHKKLGAVKELMDKYFRTKDLVIILISLGIFAIASLYLFDDANNWMLYKYDDVDHLDYSYNLYHGNGLQKGVIDLEANTLEKNIPALANHDRIESHLIGKNPFYFVILGAWLYVFNASFENWFFYGSIFNMLLTAICIVAFYFLVKKFFGIESALLATPLLATMPGLIWYAVRIRPDILLFLLIIIAVYFGLRKFNSYYAIVTGVFVGLAHFTHPLGIILGVSLLIYYLIMRKLKEACLFFLTWFVILVPWLVRNYLVFGDPIRGFGLPIPRSLLVFLGVTSPDSPGLNVYPDTFHGINVIDTLRGMIDSFSNIYGMNYFLLFISLSLAAYVSFSSVKNALLDNNRNKLIFGCVLVVYFFCVYYVLTQQMGMINFLFSILIIFLIPLTVFLYIKGFSSYKNIFTTNHNPAYLLIGIYTIINFLTYILYTQITGRVTPEVRIILISLYLLIPLAIIGLRRILDSVFFLLNERKKRIATLTSMIVLLSIFSIYQSFIGISLIDSRFEDLSARDYQLALNRWVIENVPADSDIATDFPHLLTIQTGLDSVNFAHQYKDYVSYEKWIIKKFDIDYLVFYYYKKGNQPLSNLDLGNFYLQKVYQGKNGGLVYKVEEK